MKTVASIVAVFALVLSFQAWATPLEITLAPSPGNPSTPQMGDHLIFHSTIANRGDKPLHSIMAWLSIVQIDPDNVQPIDLEDWSAQKAVTQAVLDPGQLISVDWPIRLIQAGHYRVVVSALDQDATGLVTSPLATFTVKEKPVVVSARVLPVAFGVPLFIAALLALRFLARFGRKAARS